MTETLTMLLSWLLAILAWSPSGLWLLRKLNSELKDKPIHNFIVATVLGAAINSALLGFISFFFPITIYVSMILVLVNIILFSRIYMNSVKSIAVTIKEWPYLNTLGFVVVLILTIISSLHVTLNNDSGLYYIQFMKWINSYPVLPGLANLHDRFGFNSHWHLLSAAFDVNNLGGMTNDLNGLLFLLIGLGSFDSAGRLSRNPSLYDAIWALFPLPFFLLLRFLTSTAPDLSSTLIPLLYFTLLIDGKRNASFPLIATLMVFAATIKVMSVLHALALLPFLFWVLQKKDRKSIWVTVGLVGLICIPWLGRNVIQTGYLVFPMESIDLFHVDWKVPSDLAADARKMVDTHARLGSYDLTDYGKPFSDWFPFWFGVQSKTVLALLVFALMSSFLLVVADVLKIDRNRSSEHTFINLFLALSALVSFAFWWKSGPNPRFIYGIVFFFTAYSLAVVIVHLRLTKWARFVPILALIPMLWFTKVILAESGPKRPGEFGTMHLSTRDVHYPIGTDKCWEHDLPCANMERVDLELRGNELENGFRNTD